MYVKTPQSIVNDYKAPFHLHFPTAVQTSPHFHHTLQPALKIIRLYRKLCNYKLILLKGKETFEGFGGKRAVVIFTARS